MLNRVPDWLGFKLAFLWGVHVLGAPARTLHRILLYGHLGSGFRIGRGSCVVGRTIRVGNNVTVGRHTTIVAENVEIEDGVRVGDNVTIRCRHLILKSKSRIDARTVVYGILSPNSAFILGRGSWIYSDCHINTDERVSIGDRTAAGSFCLIFTHSSYLPITHGYPVTIAAVDIGNDVWLPWHVFLLPGVQIGDGATVGAFSLVVGKVPADSLAVGVPARVVKDADNYRRKYSEKDLDLLIEKVVGDAVSYTVNAFRPKSLFVPQKRTFEHPTSEEWTLGDESSVVRVVISAEGGIDSRELDIHSNALLFIAARGTGAFPKNANWVDPVSLRSSLGPDLHPLLGEVVQNLSAFGIRFGSKSENEWSASIGE